MGGRTNDTLQTFVAGDCFAVVTFPALKGFREIDGALLLPSLHV